MKRNPFIKGRGHLVQKAAKKYWDEELGGDIKKVTEYTKSKKRGPVGGLLKFGFTKRRWGNKPSTISQSTNTEAPHGGERGVVDISVLVDVDDEQSSSDGNTADKPTDANNEGSADSALDFLTYISTFTDSIGGNGRAIVSNPSIATHDALSILFEVGKCFDGINPLLSTYYDGVKRQRKTSDLYKALVTCEKLGTNAGDCLAQA